MWLIPFGHRKRSYPQDYHTALVSPSSCSLSRRDLLRKRLRKRCTICMATKYQVGTGADIMYEASGGSHDWAKGSLKVNYAYLIELRPQNTALG
ncbi:hypothetical protein COOONC_14415 [Cooperia oncophora]